MKLYRKQRRKYRFDERETWSLKYTSLIWLYEHINMYLDIGGKIVDLDCPLDEKIKKKLAEQEDLEFATQHEVLDFICKQIEKWDKIYEKSLSDKGWEYAQKALRVYAVILPLMRW